MSQTVAMIENVEMQHVNTKRKKDGSIMRLYRKYGITNDTAVTAAQRKCTFNR